MTTTLVEPTAAPRAGRESPPDLPSDPADRLRQETAAVRVSFTWFGTRKTLTAGQKAEAAGAFGAEGKFLSAGKKLLDTSHPRFQAVTAVKGRATAYWRSVSLPYLRNGPRGQVWLPHDGLEHAVAPERHAAAPPTTEPMQSVQGLPAKKPGKRLSGRLPKWQAGGSS